MKKTKQIESIILRMLSDGKCHSTKEFKEEILQVNPELLVVANTLSSVLYQMRVKKKQIEKDGNGFYILSFENKAEEKNDNNKNVKFQMLELWRNFYSQNNMLKNVSYEMNEKEFAEGKKMYELNKKIEETIKSYL